MAEEKISVLETRTGHFALFEKFLSLSMPILFAPFLANATVQKLNHRTLCGREIKSAD
jgi:hypothetical protein